MYQISPQNTFTIDSGEAETVLIQNDNKIVEKEGPEICISVGPILFTHSEVAQFTDVWFS